MDKYISGSSKYSCFICWVLCFLCNATRLEIEQTVWLQKNYCQVTKNLHWALSPRMGWLYHHSHLFSGFLCVCCVCPSLCLFRQQLFYFYLNTP